MPKRILIVEDDLPAAAALAHVLEREGCVVRTVRSGEEALDSSTSDPPDVIALDLKLSGALDGYAVMSRLKERGKKAPTVVIVTNFGLPQEVEKGKASGARAYLVKSEHSIHEIARLLMEVA